jgi:ADP-ribose pyrophosphatase
VLVNQFRYPTLAKGPGWLTEIVAGGLDADETPESAIAREVREETGHEVHELEPIATFFASPGGCSERVFLYYGEIDGAERTAAPKGRLGVGDEDIQVVERTAAELWDDLRAGRLQDAKTIIALLWLKTQGLP